MLYSARKSAGIDKQLVVSLVPNLARALFVDCRFSCGIINAQFDF